MNKNVDFIFVRHGESNGNIGVKDDSTHPDDPKLTLTGLRQAQKLAEAYAQEPLQAIYASALIRACQTVQPLAAEKQTEVRVMRELMEVGTGIPNTSLMLAELYAKNALKSLRDTAEAPVRFPPDDATPAVCAARAAYCVDTILSECEDGAAVMICTHGGFIGYLMRYCLGLSLPEPFNWQIDNCAVFRIRFFEDRIPKLIRANDISHLI